MAELRDYRVTFNGHETVMRLTTEDAERLGGVPVEQAEAKQASASTKKRTARNKTADGD